MTQKYFVMITNYGEGQLANAAALDIPLELKHMAVGDANGTEPLPGRTQTALINETYRAQINSLSVDENNPSQIIAEVVIPETIGGWFIREIGLYDTAGYLFAVANCPPSYKPQMSEGSGRTQVIRLVLVVSSTDNITLKIDPAVVVATRSYVDQKFKGRKVKSGTGLDGGGDLSSDITLTVKYGDEAGTAVEGNDPRITGALQSEEMTHGLGNNAELPISQKAVSDQIIGFGQSWKNVTSNRVKNSIYTNTEGRVITLSISASSYAGGALKIDGEDVSKAFDLVDGYVYSQTYCQIPEGAEYSFHGDETLLIWAELR